MHTSAEMFDRIQTLYVRATAPPMPMFFCRAADAWDRVAADDLESFYRHVHGGRFQATVILTPYSVGQRSMLVAHYESPTEAAHRIWSVGPDGQLKPIYESPVESRRYFRSGSRAA
jgi:hypothetical protein